MWGSQTRAHATRTLCTVPGLGSVSPVSAAGVLRVPSYKPGSRLGGLEAATTVFSVALSELLGPFMRNNFSVFGHPESFFYFRRIFPHK